MNDRPSYSEVKKIGEEQERSSTIGKGTYATCKPVFLIHRNVGAKGLGMP